MKAIKTVQDGGSNNSIMNRKLKILVIKNSTKHLQAIVVVIRSQQYRLIVTKLVLVLDTRL